MFSLKLWQGRFEGASESVTNFNSSENIKLDEKLVFYDIIGSIAHAKMLSKKNIIPQKDASEIIRALKEIIKAKENGGFTLDPSLEDVHTNVENTASKITESGKKMHTARSRNDQVLLDMRMYMRDEILEISNLVYSLQKAFQKLSVPDGVYPGYTHTRIAQPLTLSFWCQSQVESLNRDLEKLVQLYGRVNKNPLGACALSGTSFEIDRKYTAELLGFSGVQENSLDVINSRGEIEAEFIFILSSIAFKLSSVCEELIWLSEKGLVKIPDEFCTGSSMMPNKKNPDILEITRSRTGRVYGNLINVLTIKKGLMHGYNSDMQETKGALMDSIDVSKETLKIITSLVPKLSFNFKEIEKELESGFAQATLIAEKLVQKGVAFRQAHAIVGELVTKCEKDGLTLNQIEHLPQFSKEEWIEVTTLVRPNLKVEVKVGDEFYKVIFNEKQKLAECFSDLLK